MTEAQIADAEMDVEAILNAAERLSCLYRTEAGRKFLAAEEGHIRLAQAAIDRLLIMLGEQEAA